jgi:hypothetical protein
MISLSVLRVAARWFSWPIVVLASTEYDSWTPWKVASMHGSLWDKIAALAGLVAAFAGAVSAVYAFRSAETAWRALESSTIYQIQRDSIDLARDYKEGKIGPGSIISMMYSIWYQRQKEVIDDALWPSLNYEYCRMMQEDRKIQEFWDKVDKNFYGDQFTRYVSGLRGGQRCA